MFVRLWIALSSWGESRGKPFLGMQAMGIPVVAWVFFTLRAQMHNHVAFNSLLASDPPDWSFIVAGLILIVYAADFISDAIAWDGIGVKFVSWQLILAVGWILFASFVVLTLTLVLPLFGYGMGFLDMLWNLRYLISGGLLYGFLKWRGGLMMAMGGPVVIAFVFACAVFAGLPGRGLFVYWFQGFFLFLLNILLMQFFEKDKDAVSNTPNLWLLVSHQMMFFTTLFLGMLVFLGWILLDTAPSYNGIVWLLLTYALMYGFPRIFRWGRLYRLLIDVALLLWLI